MRAVSRIGLAMAAAGLALAPVPAFAQAAPAATTTGTPASDAIGPKELQNFNLSGTVTKPAETPAAPAPSSPPQSRNAAPPAGERTATATSTTSRPPSSAQPRTAAASQPASPAPNAAQSLTFNAPATATPASVPEPGFAPETTSGPVTIEPQQSLLLWPWLLLAAAIGVAGAYVLWRRRAREAFAGGPEIDAFVAPEPQPAPRPAPPPPAVDAPPAKPVGMVSSRLRPWVDIAFAPLGCSVDEERVVVDFEVQLTNSGSAPARDVLVEASMFNAGATQEQDIGQFFAHPVGQGERIQVIAPLQQVAIRTQLVAPRANIQIFEMGGHQVFVPLVAFNALYRLSSGTGQTSSAYLLGRETRSEKLGPFRTDLGPKAFANLGNRPLPIGVRN